MGRLVVGGRVACEQAKGVVNRKRVVDASSSWRYETNVGKDKGPNQAEI